MVSLDEGITRRIDWPNNDFYTPEPEHRPRRDPLLGVEPNLRWRRFSGLVVELAREHGVELVVTLGALLADVPHTRPSPVTGAASDPARRAASGSKLRATRARPASSAYSRTLPDAGIPLSEPVGRRAALRLARPQPTRRARALPPAREPARVPIETAELEQADETYPSR